MPIVKRIRQLVAVAAVFMMTSVLANARQESRTTGQIGTARIRGRVTGLPSGAILHRARVVAIPDDRRARNEPRSALTDTTGRYEISGLPAGRYRIVAEKAGYVTSGSAGRNSTLAIDVTDRATIERADVVLARTSVIACESRTNSATRSLERH